MTYRVYKTSNHYTCYGCGANQSADNPFDLITGDGPIGHIDFLCTTCLATKIDAGMIGNSPSCCNCGENIENEGLYCGNCRSGSCDSCGSDLDDRAYCRGCAECRSCSELATHCDEHINTECSNCSHQAEYCEDCANNHEECINACTIPGCYNDPSTGLCSEHDGVVLCEEPRCYETTAQHRCEKHKIIDRIAAAVNASDDGREVSVDGATFRFG